MSRDLKRQLIIAYIIFALVALGTGFIGHVTHHLDVGSTITLCFFFAASTVLYTWLMVHEERTTRERVLEVQADLEALNLRVLKGKSGVYVVTIGEALSSVIVTEDLSLEELEAFRDGIMQGLLMAYDEQEPETDTDDMEARLARQAAQFEEDKNYFSMEGYHEDE